MVLECRKLKRYDPVVMEAAARLLKVVPEVCLRYLDGCGSQTKVATCSVSSNLNQQIYTIWNFRREALAAAFEAGGETAQVRWAIFSHTILYFYP